MLRFGVFAVGLAGGLTRTTSSGALTQIPHHQYVVAGTIEEFREHVARRAWAIVAENALIRDELFQLGARGCGNLVQNLVEAGTERFNFKAPTVPRHLSLIGRLVRG